MKKLLIITAIILSLSACRTRKPVIIEDGGGLYEYKERKAAKVQTDNIPQMPAGQMDTERAAGVIYFGERGELIPVMVLRRPVQKVDSL